MRDLRIILTLLVSLIAMHPATAQKKGETKLFNNAIAKGDTISFNKFLTKYPKSVYAPIVQAKKDSLIKSYNTTALSPEEAAAIIKANVPALANTESGIGFIALSGKKNNKEYIVGVVAPQKDDPSTLKVIRIDQTEQGGWQESLSTNAARYMQDDALTLFSMASINDLFCNRCIPEEVVIDGDKYICFYYLNYSTGSDERSGWPNNNIELVANLVSMADGTIYSTTYAGERNGDIIEGSLADIAQGGSMSTPQMTWLMRSLGKSSQLKPFDREKALTKKAIQWWYDNNPQGSSKLNFGVLEEDHPIVKRFLEDKYIEKSKNNRATFFNIMGTTVVCNYNKSTNQYLLLSCEKEPANPKTEKNLNTLYFEKENVIVLYYYKGKQAIKERIDLNAKTRR
ncbi:MAG: hypothetical protein IKY70_00280 [Bacteroidales bacterium]|nr:hypothetical protein [Bacteroidales bacterium]